jgi:hypothetical protein
MLSLLCNTGNGPPLLLPRRCPSRRNTLPGGCARREVRCHGEAAKGGRRGEDGGGARRGGSGGARGRRQVGGRLRGGSRRREVAGHADVADVPGGERAAVPAVPGRRRVHAVAARVRRAGRDAIRRRHAERAAQPVGVVVQAEAAGGHAGPSRRRDDGRAGRPGEPGHRQRRQGGAARRAQVGRLLGEH